MQRTCTWPVQYYQWPEREAYVAWQGKYETWEKVRLFSTVCRADHFWGGEGGWGRGLGDFEKYTYTLYILEVHIGKKRILHKSTVQKKISRTYSGLKKKNLPEILPVPQTICFSRKFLLARRFGKIDMSLEGTCCWEMDNSGCRRGFGAQNSWYVPFVRNIPPPPPLPTEGLNFALWPHPNWLTSQGSGCRMLVHLAGWELFYYSCWE